MRNARWFWVFVKPRPCSESGDFSFDGFHGLKQNEWFKLNAETAVKLKETLPKFVTLHKGINKPTSPPGEVSSFEAPAAPQPKSKPATKPRKKRK